MTIIITNTNFIIYLSYPFPLADGLDQAPSDRGQERIGGHRLRRGSASGQLSQHQAPRPPTKKALQGLFSVVATGIALARLWAYSWAELDAATGRACEGSGQRGFRPAARRAEPSDD